MKKFLGRILFTKKVKPEEKREVRMLRKRFAEKERKAEIISSEKKKKGFMVGSEEEAVRARLLDG